MPFWKRQQTVSLDQAAQALAGEIGKAVIEWSQTPLEASAAKEMRWAVLQEWTALFLHLLDRAANEVLEPNQKSVLVPTVWGLVVSGLVDSYFEGEPQKKISIASSLVADFFEPRHLAYGQCKPIAPPGESPSGTILWEFAKRIAEAQGRKDDVAIIMGTQVYATRALQRIDFKEVLQILFPR